MPVRWIEDRREHLTRQRQLPRASLQDHRLCRSRRHGCAASTARRPSIPAPTRPIPFSACLEAAQVASILPGPYRMPAYRCRTFSVATNKCPILPYRGVARTGVCFALEIMLDAVAAEAGIEPGEVRLRNLVGPDEMPFDNITNKHFDSGDYPRSDAARARGDRHRGGARASARRRAGRTADRRRPFDLLRTGRARHVGLCRLGHSDGARPRAGHRAHDARRRARNPGRRAFARPGPGNDAGPGRARDSRHRHRARCASSTATPR